MVSWLERSLSDCSGRTTKNSRSVYSSPGFYEPHPRSRIGKHLSNFFHQLCPTRTCLRKLLPWHPLFLDMNNPYSAIVRHAPRARSGVEKTHSVRICRLLIRRVDFLSPPTFPFFIIKIHMKGHKTTLSSEPVPTSTGSSCMLHLDFRFVPQPHRFTFMRPSLDYVHHLKGPAEYVCIALQKVTPNAAFKKTVGITYISMTQVLQCPLDSEVTLVSPTSEELPTLRMHVVVRSHSISLPPSPSPPPPPSVVIHPARPPSHTAAGAARVCPTGLAETSPFVPPPLPIPPLDSALSADVATPGVSAPAATPPMVTDAVPADGTLPLGDADDDDYGAGDDETPSSGSGSEGPGGAAEGYAGDALLVGTPAVAGRADEGASAEGHWSPPTHVLAGLGVASGAAGGGGGSMGVSGLPAFWDAWEGRVVGGIAASGPTPARRRSAASHCGDMPGFALGNGSSGGGGWSAVVAADNSSEWARRVPPGLRGETTTECVSTLGSRFAMLPPVATSAAAAAAASAATSTVGAPASATPGGYRPDAYGWEAVTALIPIPQAAGPLADSGPGTGVPPPSVLLEQLAMRRPPATAAAASPPPAHPSPSPPCASATGALPSAPASSTPLSTASCMRPSVPHATAVASPAPPPPPPPSQPPQPPQHQQDQSQQSQLQPQQQPPAAAASSPLLPAGPVRVPGRTPPPQLPTDDMALGRSPGADLAGIERSLWCATEPAPLDANMPLRGRTGGSSPASGATAPAPLVPPLEQQLAAVAALARAPLQFEGADSSAGGGAEDVVVPEHIVLVEGSTRRGQRFASLAQMEVSPALAAVSHTHVLVLSPSHRPARSLLLLVPRSAASGAAASHGRSADSARVAYGCRRVGIRPCRCDAAHCRDVRAEVCACPPRGQRCHTGYA